MDQNQITDNQITDNQDVDNDLQKAIDNITNPTNIDPVFSDPIAAPSSIPEGDTGELGEPIGPFPEPKSIITTHAPEAITHPAPVTPNIDDSVLSPILSTVQSTHSPEPVPPQAIASISEPRSALQQDTTTQPFPTLNTAEVKKAALRDLFPVLGKININALQKFKIYRDIFEELKDYTVLESAYQAAREIADETARAEALLYIVESIDRM